MLELAADIHFKESKRQSGVTLFGILKKYLPSFLSQNNISPEQSKVLQAIYCCGSKLLGVYVRKCNGCGYVEAGYCSCRNRRCPGCQGASGLNWMQKRIADLLPVPYYHVVFTMPHELNDLCLYNKRLTYEFFFNCVAKTLQDFTATPKYLGARPGFIMVLHTWGQKLAYHVHLHVLITGGGLSDQYTWKALPYRKEFLFPVKAVSKMVRGKFLAHLKEAYRSGELTFPDTMRGSESLEGFQCFLDLLYRKEWYCYSKPAFGSAESVVEYLGSDRNKVAITDSRLGDLTRRPVKPSGISDAEAVVQYFGDNIYKAGISNSSLVNLTNEEVTFEYKDYKDNNKKKFLTLHVEEFLRRFLLHILPKGFKRVRYYGVHSCGGGKSLLKKAQAALSVCAEAALRRAQKVVPFTKEQVCSKCGKGALKFVEYVPAEMVPFLFDTS